MLSATLAGAVFFFFSSRRRHTRSKRDWSSDVCSSDLHRPAILARPSPARLSRSRSASALGSPGIEASVAAEAVRSEERRVGKEGGAGRSPERGKKKPCEVAYGAGSVLGEGQRGLITAA